MDAEVYICGREGHQKVCTMYVTTLIWRHIAESQSIWRDVAQRFQITCAHCAHKRVDIIPVFRSRIKRFLKSVRHTARRAYHYDLHRSSDGRDCEGLWVQVLSVLITCVKEEGYTLLGVLGRRQLAPLCNMW